MPALWCLTRWRIALRVVERRGGLLSQESSPPLGLSDIAVLEGATARFWEAYAFHGNDMNTLTSFAIRFMEMASRLAEPAAKNLLDAQRARLTAHRGRHASSP